MICRNCGRELPEDARFCGRCGAPVVRPAAAAPAAPSTPAPEQAAPAAEQSTPAAEQSAPAAEQSAPAPEQAASAPEQATAAHTAPAAERPQPQIPPPLSSGAPSWSSSGAPAAAPAPAQQAADASPLRTGQFFLMDLVCAIPLVNIVVLLVWAFADNTNLNRRNYARARLIWVAVGIVLTILALVVLIWAMSRSYWYLRY